MVIDVSEATFATEVLERSSTVPVVVDFWAAWCGPCRALGPLLEKAVEKREGEVVLAKVDVDANPRLQMQFGIRGIPAVKAFKDGRVVREFVGAQPAGVVERFVESLVPSQADRLVVAGDEASLRQALEADPDHVGARVALARRLLDAGKVDEVEALLAPVEHDMVAAALPVLVDAVRAAAGEQRDLLRRVVVGIFGELGEDHELTRRYRPELAAALY
jgi:putative thioredoxin